MGMAVIPLIALAGGGPASAGAAAVRAGRPEEVGVQMASAAPQALAGTVPSIIAAPSTTVAPVSTTDPPVTTAAAPAAVQVAAYARSAVVVVHIAPPATVPPVTTTTAPLPSETGPASWYGAAPGTCAHQSLPFGTVVTIVNLATGATATCTVDDRGPYEGGRIIDLAPDVFAKLAPTSEGVINVRITW